MKVLNNQTISFLMTYEYNTNLVIYQIILYLIYLKTFCCWNIWRSILKQKMVKYATRCCHMEAVFSMSVWEGKM